MGKTTTAINLASGLALGGHKTLLIDMDPQAAASIGLGEDVFRDDRVRGMYDVLCGDTSIDSITIQISHVSPDLYLAPSSIDLAAAEVELVTRMARESVLKRRIKDISEDYEFVIIDTPPSLGILFIVSLVAARELIVPVSAEYYPLVGLRLLLDAVDMAKAGLGTSHEIKVLITMARQQIKLHQKVIEKIHGFGDLKVFKTIIPNSVKVAESPSHCLPVIMYDPANPASWRYNDLVEEVLHG